MIFPIFIIISISISTVLILDYIQNLHMNFFSLQVVSGIIFVLILNISKFGVWSFLHKRYDLSKTYPMTAIYFPIIYIISVLKNEIMINVFSMVYILLIFIGVYLIFNADTKKEVVI